MFASRRSLTALTISSLLGLAAPAFAADEPVATADPKAPSIAAQIDDYLKTSPGVELPKDGAAGITPGDEAPRQVHGVVDVAVGTRGYRSVYVRSDFPVGKTGTLSIAVEDSKGRGGYGYGYPYGYGYGGYGRGAYDSQNLAVGLAFGGAAQDSADRRCASVAGDGPRRHRIDPMYMGPMDGGRAYACDRRPPAPEER